MVHRGEVAAEPADLLVDEVVAHLRHRAGVAVEVHDVVARRLRPVEAVPAGVEDYDVSLADLLPFWETAEDVLQRVVGPGLGDRSEIDHQARAVEIADGDLA